MPGIKIITCDWKSQQSRLAAIRYEVFVAEQQVPKHMEIDEFDADALHFLVINPANQQDMATARLLENGHIGRMAVLKPFRHQHLGSRLMEKIIEQARNQGIAKVFLHAQISAVDFYRNNGFIEVGEKFMDAGIVHVKMTRTI